MGGGSRCNRPWEEYEVNAYQYAKDKFWKAIGGMYWGDDPDFHAGVRGASDRAREKPTSGTSRTRFDSGPTETHANHGFMLHGNAGDWLGRAHSREAAAIKDRPAVLVIYHPAK